MTHRQLKVGYLALASLNTLATSYFFNYLFFFLRDRYQFDNGNNLFVSALHGFIYIFAAWQCGKFAERRGFVLSLKLGFAGLAALMVIGAFFHSTAAIIGIVVLYSIVLLLTWPALEALVSERETQAGTQQMIGIYNCTWAGSAALAYFTGGPLYDSLGITAIFWIPAALFAVQFVLTLWLDKHHNAILATSLAPPKEAPHSPEAAAFRQSIGPQAFLKMAWVANPFAYIAINTLIAVMPGIAQRLGLSPTRVGLFCSLWFFGRFVAFAFLWKWTAWHYRFRWMLSAFVLLIGSFVVILLAQELWVVVVAQLFLGFATGLIYYSSLFYSMDVGEAKGEHGGLHEAFIGLGIFVGPAAGALAFKLFPNHPHAGTWAVTTLLVAGLIGLLCLRWANRSSKA